MNTSNINFNLPNQMNLEVFNLCTALIIGDLYSNFPLCTSLDKHNYFPVTDYNDPEISGMSLKDYVQKYLSSFEESKAIDAYLDNLDETTTPSELLTEIKKAESEYNERRNIYTKNLEQANRDIQNNKIYHPIFEQTILFLDEELGLIRKCTNDPGVLGVNYKLTAKGYQLFASNQKIKIDQTLQNLLGIKEEHVSNGSLFQAICGISKSVLGKALEKGTVEHIILPILGGVIGGSTGLGAGSLAIASASVVGKIVEATLSSVTGTAYAGTQ